MSYSVFSAIHNSHRRWFVKQAIFLLLLVTIISFAVECSSSRSHTQKHPADKQIAAKDTLRSIEVTTYRSVGRALERRTNPHNGFGYDILVNGNVYIHQPYMPGGDNNTPFPSEESAKATAGFVIAKLKKHIIPPTVSQEEVDSLVNH